MSKAASPLHAHCPHIVGALGSGISGVAWYFLAKGRTVTGSDTATGNAEDPHPLEQEPNITIAKGHDALNLPPHCDALIYSPAATDQNPERAAAASRGIGQYSYPQFLGEISRARPTAAVCGTHGKSTTTALLSHILEKNNADPLTFLGADLLPAGQNFRDGAGPLVAEACEYRGAFLSLHPRVIVCTSLEHDHPDAFPSFAAYEKAFQDFFVRGAANGAVLVCPASVPQIAELAKITGIQTAVAQDYTGQLPACLPPGQASRSNVGAALLAASVLLKKPLQKLPDGFGGIARRFQLRGERGGVLVLDDYAHHPTELRVLFGAVRQRFPKRRLVCAFQAHQFSRTQAFLPEFADALAEADLVILPEIFRVRDSNTQAAAVSAKDLASLIPGAIYAADLPEALSAARRTLRAGDVFVTAGATNIWKVGRDILEGE